jgi:hypothetical protein
VLYETANRKIVYFGNPLVWVPAVLAVAATAAEAAATSNFGRIEVVFAAGYALGLVVPGAQPEYCVSLVFALLLLTRWVERVPAGARGFVGSVVIGAALFGFYLWSALAYGFYVADFGFLQWGGHWF